jgi:Fur family ferric uptake transcriptional regulator
MLAIGVCSQLRAYAESMSGARGVAETVYEPASVEARVEEVLDRLRASGGRVTTSRRLLVRTLFVGGSHRSAEELTAAVQDTSPAVHESTIYRNLNELERLGVIEHIRLGHGPAIYHLATDHHSHLVCEHCGVIFEAPVDFFTELARRAQDQVGITIAPQHFAVLGTCTPCANKLTEAYESEREHPG